MTLDGVVCCRLDGEMPALPCFTLLLLAPPSVCFSPARSRGSGKSSHVEYGACTVIPQVESATSTLLSTTLRHRNVQSSIQCQTIDHDDALSTIAAPSSLCVHSLSQLHATGQRTGHWAPSRRVPPCLQVRALTTWRTSGNLLPLLDHLQTTAVAQQVQV